MAYQIKLYDYSLDGNDYCIGSDRLNLLELTWQLECAQGQDVDVHISSVGGSAFEAIGMYDALKKYPGKVTTYVDSLAASAASIIAMAGSLVVMSKYALLMIHKPMVGSGGNADELIADAAMLNVVQSRLAGIYLDKTGLDIDTINELINATTWLTAEQALDLGFIDQIEDYSGAEVTNLAHMIKYTEGNTPVYHKRVFNKLKVVQNQIEMNTDKDLIEKNNGLLAKILNYFKKSEVKTVTNSGTIKSMAPLNVGVAVTNEDDTDTEDGEYEVDNNGVKCKVTVTNGIVTNMEDEPDGDEALKTRQKKRRLQIPQF
jgi:ATP-dependent Clp protease protease subunit